MIRWQSRPLPLSPESDYDRTLQQHLTDTYRDLTQALARSVASGGDTMTGGLFVTSSDSPTGFIGIQPGSAGRSGYVEFWSDTPVRQGYIGHSPTNAAFDSGALEYVAGFHNVTGALNVFNSARTVTGVLAAVPTATATTLFAASAGLTLVTAYVPGILPGIPGYAACAQVIHDGAGLRVIADNDFGMTITGSGVNVQVTQLSGVNQTIGFSALRVF